MSNHTACDKVKNALALGLTPNPADVAACKLQRFIEFLLRSRYWFWRIPPIPPPPGPERNGFDELTPIPSIRDLLINEVILTALKNPAFGQGIFDDLQVPGLYREVLRDFVEELDTTTKNLRAELEGLERK